MLTWFKLSPKLLKHLAACTPHIDYKKRNLHYYTPSQEGKWWSKQEPGAPCIVCMSYKDKGKTAPLRDQLEYSDQQRILYMHAHHCLHRVCFALQPTHLSGQLPANKRCLM